MDQKKPRIIIVNENDEIIGYKDRRQVTRNDIYRVSALWIKNSKGEYLLAQRSFDKVHNPGQWGPAVAGTIEEGETYESNIVKEAEEEIGLKNFDYHIAGKSRRTGRLERYNFFCQWFVALLDRKVEDFHIDHSEVEQLRWYSRAELEEKIRSRTTKFFSSLEYCLNNL